jgi:hypothetical protein
LPADCSLSPPHRSPTLFSPPPPLLPRVGAGAHSEAQLLRQWSEIWEAASNSGGKQDFIAVMLELRKRHAAEAEAARAGARKRGALHGAAAAA